MANLPDTLRVAVITHGSQAQAMTELERLLIEHGNVQLVRFETAKPFLEYMQDLVSLSPHFALIEVGLRDHGLVCLEQLRGLETGRTLPAVLLAADWNTTMLERASLHSAASCIHIPSDPTVRLEVFTALVTYWCSINEPAN
jgi:hypothetical protein